MIRLTLTATLAILFGAVASASGQTNWGLAVIGGDFVFTDLHTGRIVRLARNGSVEVVIDDVHCHNLAADDGGTVFAEAVGSGRGGSGETVALWRLTPDGRREYAMAPTSTPEPGMWTARDGAGNSYSWHREGEQRSQIFRRSPDGTSSVLAGDASGVQDGDVAEARFGHVGAIAATPAGVIYLTDSGHLRRVTRDGSVTTLARNIVSERTGGLPGDFGLFNRTVGLAVGSDETVFLADVYNLRVVRWDATRGAATVWDGSTWLARVTGGGLAWRPLGVAVAGTDLYVLESLTIPGALASLVGTPRIVRIAADGRRELVATMASRSRRAVAVLVPITLGLWLRRKWRARQRRTT